ncbi:hypothetical protein HOM50_04315 [bacterium]|jgi:hypothetical protein|nr:hypothetical protein [bacterium]MBT5015603.1 hypothetical protein [bacterium]
MLSYHKVIFFSLLIGNLSALNLSATAEKHPLVKGDQMAIFQGLKRGCSVNALDGLGKTPDDYCTETTLKNWLLETITSQQQQ